MANRQLTERMRRTIELLPENDWKVSVAGIAAGYKPCYATTHLMRRMSDNIRAQELIAKIKADMEVKTAWNIAQLQEKYMDLANRCKEFSDRTNEKAALDSLTRIQGGFTDKVMTEHSFKGYLPSERTQEELVEASRKRIESKTSALDSGSDRDLEAKPETTQPITGRE